MRCVEMKKYSNCAVEILWFHRKVKCAFFCVCSFCCVKYDRFVVETLMSVLNDWCAE